MKKVITVLLLAAISLSANADKDIYQDQLLSQCFDDGTAEDEVKPDPDPLT